MSERTSVNSTIGGNAQRSLLLPSNPYKMRVFAAGGGQVLADNVGAVIQFATVDYDTAGGWNGTTWTYLAPINGYYTVSTFVAVSTPAIANAKQSWAVWVTNGGVTVRNGPGAWYQQGGVGAGHGMADFVFDDIFVQAGDTLQVNAVGNNGGGNWTIVTGNANTWLSIHLRNS
jgi:hypothetical protein